MYDDKIFEATRGAEIKRCGNPHVISSRSYLYLTSLVLMNSSVPVLFMSMTTLVPLVSTVITVLFPNAVYVVEK